MFPSSLQKAPSEPRDHILCGEDDAKKDPTQPSLSEVDLVPASCWTTNSTFHQAQEEDSCLEGLQEKIAVSDRVANSRACDEEA